MRTVSFILASLVWFYICYNKGFYYIHLLQIDGYKQEKFVRWLDINQVKVYSREIIGYINTSMFLLLVYLIGYNIENIITFITFAYLMLFLVIMVFRLINKKESKTSFVYTKRARRLLIIYFMICFIAFIIICLSVYLFTPNFMNFCVICLALCSIVYFLVHLIVRIANCISLPLENRINGYYYKIAQKKIDRLYGLNVIGITGSYGKTSTKFIIADMLKNCFRVIKTPASYNTPMGISKVINNDLSEDHQIFVVELGATKKGDIDEVAKLVKPGIGLITSIGPCHLESFKSIDNIINTKYELVENLPKNNGIAIFNYDNKYVKQMADKTNIKKILYGLEKTEELNIYAENIIVNEKGSEFDLNIKNLGSIHCKTKLLGKHNILNILASVSVATTLGMNMVQIKDSIQNLCSVKHRLELINPKTGVLVIDDAYNSNPDGAKAALDTLSMFKNKRKVIVTPGMVELGEIEFKENYKFGEEISSICDLVILVGRKKTEPIYLGLLSKDFNKDNIYISTSSEQTTEYIRKLVKSGDIILFENDLPDTYDEN